MFPFTRTRRRGASQAPEERAPSELSLPSQRLLARPIAPVGQPLTASEVEHIGALERARADLRLAGDALTLLALDKLLAQPLRQRLYSLEEQVLDTSAALAGDVGRFYGGHPGAGMHPLSADPTRRHREYERVNSLGRTQRHLFAVARLRSGIGELRALAVMPEVDETERAVQEERSLRLAELLIRVELCGKRLHPEARDRVPA